MKNDAVKKELIDWLVHIALAIVVTFCLSLVHEPVTIVEECASNPEGREMSLIIEKKLPGASR